MAGPGRCDVGTPTSRERKATITVCCCRWSGQVEQDLVRIRKKKSWTGLKWGYLLLTTRVVIMKWTWDKFGLHEPYPKPIEKLEALFAEHLPEEDYGTVRVVATSLEPGYVMMVAVAASLGDATEPISLPPETISKIQIEFGVKALHVIRWSDDAESLIRNAFFATDVDRVLLCDLIGRATILVQGDQLSLAIGRRGQYVRLASKLCGWDIEITTADELESQIRRATRGFCELDGMTEELAVHLVGEGFLSFDDLSVIDPDTLMRFEKLDAKQAEAIIEQAETKIENDQE